MAAKNKNKKFETGAKSDVLESGLSQIPLVSLLEIGKRFVLGEKHYGRDNWKQGGEDWLYERDEHALLHMLRVIHKDEREDSMIQNLAAVGWWAIIRIWHEINKKK